MGLEPFQSALLPLVGYRFFFSHSAGLFSVFGTTMLYLHLQPTCYPNFPGVVVGNPLDDCVMPVFSKALLLSNSGLAFCFFQIPSSPLSPAMISRDSLTAGVRGVPGHAFFCTALFFRFR